MGGRLLDGKVTPNIIPGADAPLRPRVTHRCSKPREAAVAPGTPYWRR